MKKIVSIFLLFAMLFIGAHPIMAVHYCGDTLHSVRLDSKVNDCCPNDNQKNSNHKLQLAGTDCCHTNHVSFSTDNYDLSQSSIITKSYLTSINLIWPETILSLLAHPQDASPKEVPPNPPDRHTLQNSDILTYIRIFRI